MDEAVRLDWARVEQLESKDKYLIYLTNGQLYTDFLRLAPSSAAVADNFLIGIELTAFRVKQMDVLRIAPIEARFWKQLEGSVDLGLSFTSRRGIDLNQPSRLQSYVQLKLLLSLNADISPELREHRLAAALNGMVVQFEIPPTG